MFSDHLDCRKHTQALATVGWYPFCTRTEENYQDSAIKIKGTINAVIVLVVINVQKSFKQDVILGCALEG